MTRDGTALAIASDQLLSTLFALIPVPVAVMDEQGRVLLSNSAFTDVFEGIGNIASMPQRELEVPGFGVFDIQTLPLNDHGYRIVYATDVSDNVQLRRQAALLEKMASVGQLVANVAHRLNNPLADIASYMPLIEQSNLEPAAREIVDVVFARAERAGRLVQNLMTLAGITAPDYAEFDLNDIVRNVVHLRKGRRAKQCEIALDLGSDVPAAMGDAMQIEQVVLTLLTNAEEAVSRLPNRPGAIQLSTGSRAGRIQLHVCDNGYARNAVRIFEPNQSGIGLNVCAEIVKDHGGDLYAWSAYEDGTTFTLELPAYSGGASSEAAMMAAGRCLAGRRIMVVDDEVHITELIYEVLTRFGATIHIATSGSDAYTRLRTASYDLVICDQRMPGLSGESLCRMVGSAGAASRRFLFITGDGLAMPARHLFSRPGIRFLRKPFRIQDLLEAIEGLFNRSQPQDS